MNGEGSETEDLIAAARSYLGVPWRHQGRSRFGIDCVGLLVCVARDLGIPVEDARAYRRDPNAHDLARMLRRHCIARRPAAARPGDIAVMGKPATHVGILTDAFAPFGLIHVPIDGDCVEVRFDADIHALRGIYRPLVS